MSGWRDIVTDPDDALAFALSVFIIGVLVFACLAGAVGIYALAKYAYLWSPS